MSLYGYITCCQFLTDIATVVGSIIALVLYLPFMPFICFASLLCPAEKALPEERDVFIPRDRTNAVLRL